MQLINWQNVFLLQNQICIAKSQSHLLDVYKLKTGLLQEQYALFASNEWELHILGYCIVPPQHSVVQIAGNQFSLWLVWSLSMLCDTTFLMLIGKNILRNGKGFGFWLSLADRLCFEINCTKTLIYL